MTRKSRYYDTEAKTGITKTDCTKSRETQGNNSCRFRMNHWTICTCKGVVMHPYSIRAVMPICMYVCMYVYNVSNNVIQLSGENYPAHNEPTLIFMMIGFFVRLKKQLNVWSRVQNAPVQCFSAALSTNMFAFFAKKKKIIMKMRVILNCVIVRDRIIFITHAHAHAHANFITLTRNHRHIWRTSVARGSCRFFAWL